MGLLRGEDGPRAKITRRKVLQREKKKTQGTGTCQSKEAKEPTSLGSREEWKNGVILQSKVFAPRNPREERKEHFIAR